MIAYPTFTKRLVYSRYGDETALDWLEAAVPPLQPGQILVRVEAVSVNPVDYKILAGEQKLFTGRNLRHPRVFACDFAGTVAAVHHGPMNQEPTNPQVETHSSLAAGDRVTGFLNPLAQGSASQYLVMPARQCVRIPQTVSTAQAAALPVAGITALRTIASKPESWWHGKSVYLNGAAGGVGHLLVQLLSALGAQVHASASPPRHAELLSLGAKACVDYRQVKCPADLGRFNAVIDCHGNLVKARHHDLFNGRGGLFIKISLPNDAIPGAIWRIFSQRLLHGQDSRVMLSIPSGKLLTMALDRVARGQLKPRIEAVFPITQAREAVALARNGHVFGKLIINLF